MHPDYLLTLALYKLITYVLRLQRQRLLNIQSQFTVYPYAAQITDSLLSLFAGQI